MDPTGKPPVLDAHLHSWELGRVPYPWLTPELGGLHRSFPPAEAAGELAGAGVVRALLVQAADDARDTAYLLEVAAAHPWAAGVVGWVPLDDAAATEAALARGGHALAGVRHLVGEETDPAWLRRPERREALAVLAARGVVLDVAPTESGHLRAAVAVAAAFPALTVVLDHLGGPPRRRAAEWAALVADAAALPNTAVKLSGLLLLEGEPAPWPVVARHAERVLELFGPDRTMWGSDWPVCTLGGSYSESLAAGRRALRHLDPAGRHAVLGATAARTYGLAT